MAGQSLSQGSLGADEKKYLLYVERGDVASVRRCLASAKENDLNIDCCDPLGRSALIIAIENENLELAQLLLQNNVQSKDGLLHAISEEFVEAVEVLIEDEENTHQPGTPYSWESIDPDTATFTADITPLILAAHKNNYEILKLLLDRGATLPLPHDVKCGCDECVISSQEDSLRHSRARINAYRALSSPSLIALSSKDPILTAFELSAELGRLSNMETEFCVEYQDLRIQVQDFATALLDHIRTSYELEVILNYDPDGAVWEPGEHMQLERVKLAIKHKQKKFVAHPTIQQLLATIWYEGVPGFRRKSMLAQILESAKMGATYPVYSLLYLFAPESKNGQYIKKPFVKFICNSASYLFFLFLLAIASQRAEHLVMEWFGPESWQILLQKWKHEERGALPGVVECLIVLWVVCLIWYEIKELWKEGILGYMSDMWNILDFINYSFYMAWVGLRVASWLQVKMELQAGLDPHIPREKWYDFDPLLISEGMFGAAMIFSFLKMVHIFSVNQYLGPLQISLGRMVYDIMKFFFIYTLVLFAFACGMNQLLWFYAEREKHQCYRLPGGLPDWEHSSDHCTKWRRFANLFESSQSLFWASFGLVDLMNFDLSIVKSYTRFWSLLMFGSYSVINVVVLLNLLIAMMSNSYNVISERSDVEWKFARTTLWMSFFEEGQTVPPPFNIIPSPKSIQRFFGFKKKITPASFKRKSREAFDETYVTVMRNLVRRYVTVEQRKGEEHSVTEDEVNEIKQDISTFRYELLDILKNNGMNTVLTEPIEKEVIGKKVRTKERRLLKGFNIGLVEGIVDGAGGQRVSNKFWKVVMMATGRYQKRNWNDVVSSIQKKQDQIGSSQWSLMREQSSQSLDVDPEEYSDTVRRASALFKSRLQQSKELSAKEASANDLEAGTQQQNGNCNSVTSSNDVLASINEVHTPQCNKNTTSPKKDVPNEEATTKLAVCEEGGQADQPEDGHIGSSVDDDGSSFHSYSNENASDRPVSNASEHPMSTPIFQKPQKGWL